MYKKLKIIIVALCITLMVPHSLQADLVDFSLGCATSFLIHEATHWIVGNAMGKLTFEPDENGWPVAVYRGDNEGAFKSASAGFVADLSLQEYYLQKRPEGDIWKGIFWYSVCSNLLYCFDDDGDFKGMSDASGISVGTLHTIMATLTILDIYRYYHNERRIQLLIAPKAISFSFVVTFK